MLALVALGLVVSFFVASNLLMMRYRRDFQIDATLFRNNVLDAVSNYLSSVYSAVSADVSDSSSSSSSSADFVSVIERDFGQYLDLRGNNIIVIGDNEYSEGDYMDLGLITKISDRRFYVQGTNGVIVCRMRSRAPTRRAEARNASADDDI